MCAAAQSNEVVAERVLGPQWKRISRRAGIIFAGTVMSAPQTVSRPVLQNVPQAVANPMKTDRAVAAVELKFRVDRSITGAKKGQFLTIHEWAGAQSRHRPMRPGQHLLLFLYPPSRLGLTSPVGGSLGQIELDPSGENVAPVFAAKSRVPVAQLESAIRAARGE
jgi:hypothetical protein